MVEHTTGMLVIAGSSPTRFNQEIFPQLCRRICLTLSAELCRLCHLPTPYSAVARSEQWLDLCSRPSDEDVKWRSRRQESHPLPGSLNTNREE